MKKLSILFFVCGVILILISIDSSITGAVIGGASGIKNNILFIGGLASLITSFVLFVHGKSLLEAIVIPTGSLEADRERTGRAMEKYSEFENPTPYVLITGDIEQNAHGELKNSRYYSIYEELREKYNLKPSDMIIEGKSQDTLENFLYSVKKLKKKGIDKMEIATNRTQFWRFKMFEKKAKKEGLIKESFKIKPLYTHESFKEFIYGILALIKDYFRIKSTKSLEAARKNSTGHFGSFLKMVSSDE